VKPAEKLSLLLEEKRVSRAEIAKAISVGYSTFMTYLQSPKSRMPAAGTAVAIARFLSVPSDWLWSEDDYPPPDLQNISLLPDAVVMEEILRRKRSIAEALDRLLTRYRELRAHHVRIFSDPTFTPEKVDMEPGGATRQTWDNFWNATHSYYKSIDHWMDFNSQWFKIDIYPDLDAPDFKEMMTAMDILSLAQKTPEKEIAIRNLVANWGHPKYREKKLGAKMAGESELSAKKGKSRKVK